jgi:adenylate cyclase
LDPQYALAYCGLAFSYNELVRLSWIDTDWGYRKAKNELQKALQLDHRLGEAYAVLGTIKLVHDWDIPASKAYLMQALHFSPNSVQVLRMLANYYVWTGSYEKGIQTAKQAIELDPFTPMINMLVPFAYFYANRYEESISQLQNVLSLEPNFIWAHIYLAHNYTMKGMSAEAVKHLDWVESQNSSFLPFVAFDYARSGNPEKAREIIEMIQAYPKEQSVDPITMASIYAGLGEKEKAFEWLGKGYQSRSGLMVYLKAYSRTFLKEINTDVRYKTLLKKIGFSK